MKFTDPKTEYIHSDISLKDLAEKRKGQKGCSFANLARRCEEEKWVLLRRRFKIKAMIETDERMAETIAEMNKRNLAIALDLQDKAGTALDKLKFEKASDAASTLKISQDMIERAKKGGTDIRHILEIVYPNGNGDKTE